jgi:hypothetical protein
VNEISRLFCNSKVANMGYWAVLKPGADVHRLCEELGTPWRRLTRDTSALPLRMTERATIANATPPFMLMLAPATSAGCLNDKGTTAPNLGRKSNVKQRCVNVLSNYPPPSNGAVHVRL